MYGNSWLLPATVANSAAASACAATTASLQGFVATAAAVTVVADATHLAAMFAVSAGHVQQH